MSTDSGFADSRYGINENYVDANLRPEGRHESWQGCCRLAMSIGSSKRETPNEAIVSPCFLSRRKTKTRHTTPPTNTTYV
jgi:hypothetical protein